MKSRLVFLLLGAMLIATPQIRATVLPESCGGDETRFDVKVAKPPEGQPAPDIAPPAAGKAQIVFVETVNAEGFQWTTPTTRFGLDGQWVGANHGDSHFAIDVTPGEHNVCVNWQSENLSESNRVGMDTFTAEAGKIYYYEIKIVRIPGAERMDFLFDLKQLGGIEGRYRVKASGVSTWKSKKQTN
ncbi:MAG: hypothetical protein ACRD3S_01455 [Terracidiphilus sp.]